MDLRGSNFDLVVCVLDTECPEQVCNVDKSYVRATYCPVQTRRPRLKNQLGELGLSI